ncbi:GntR family transcriptional regulator [Paracoccus onubensis]|uniref:GntR family transcriptional regulator n=1 Tax=Paracoccus onubensis TaxID=1675788 RepID=UPI00272F52EF|nr:GntR family transcriptional regulator [Paracoccus onubensis]MDP0929685.1 GntR family transcriptional regulator [Paracoccus onubensis]
MKRSKLKRSLVDEIAEAIQVGEYRADEWLRQVDLEEKFQATRFDVRSALEALVVRKVVQHVPNRGYKVPSVDPEMSKHQRDVRVVVETAAAPMIIKHVTDSDTTQLDKLAGEFAQAAKSGDHVDQSRTNRAFHEAMFNLTKNPVMVEIIWLIRDRGRSAPFTIWRSMDTLQQSVTEHQKMVEAIAARDAEALAQLIEIHIRRPH